RYTTQRHCSTDAAATYSSTDHKAVEVVAICIQFHFSSSSPGNGTIESLQFYHALFVIIQSVQIGLLFRYDRLSPCFIKPETATYIHILFNTLSHSFGYPESSQTTISVPPSHEPTWNRNNRKIATERLKCSHSTGPSKTIQVNIR